jgi:TRAP-type C4-dicarboxylate transport system permease small subunit
VGKLISSRHGREFIRHVVPAVLKPARTLWNEVIGFLFLCFAIIFGFKAVRTYLDFAEAPAAEATEHLVRLAMTVFCTLLMLYFGVTSFLRARKISRS